MYLQSIVSDRVASTKLPGCRTLSSHSIVLPQERKLCRVIQNLLSNRRFHVELNNERSRWRKQNNGLPKGSVLTPTLFNIYNYDQPIHNGTRSFIYADDLCITAQYQSFKQVEDTMEEALDNITIYYNMNSLRANLEKKTQVTAFHLRNKEENRSLKVVWNKTEIENTAYPKYLQIGRFATNNTYITLK